MLNKKSIRPIIELALEEDIEERLKDLANMKNVLTKLINQCICEEVSTDECPILEVIDNKSGV